MDTNPQLSKFKQVLDTEELHPGDQFFDGKEFFEVPDNWLQRTPFYLRDQGFLMKHVKPFRPLEAPEEDKLPASIVFMNNGQAVTFDDEKKMIMKYCGEQSTVIERLEANGTPWDKIAEIMGKPNA